ncbi:MAG TPA: 4,5-DOPA dioxygenase extradiol [Cyclobacteriaceae bacterium]|nr:4,5-DOPA dioxygenase extradiol [Cyclobacteriaceae bacterium]
MSLKNLDSLTGSFNASERFPLLFLGHGSPMNAIEENEFVQGWRKAGENLEKPNAILCISAHWETKGTQVTAMLQPPTIHDFYGFPKALYEVDYPAPGSPELAEETKQTIKSTQVELDHSWGLDHGAWSVVKHLFPNADVPIVQMSLDSTQPPAYHYALAKELNSLRRKGVLIVGSGNMVHNLRIMDWGKPNEGYDWAQEANEKMKKYIHDGDHLSLVNYNSGGKAMRLSVPTPEHYLPLLYILALKENDENVQVFNDKTIMGSIAMTSISINSNT